MATDSDETKELYLQSRGPDRLIRYHQDGLSQYRMQMSPAVQYLEAQTIKALRELKARRDNDRQTG